MQHIVVTGSVAFDRIAVFKDRFSAHILPEKMHVLNVAFTVDNLSLHFGGTGGNIAYNLALLGERPYLAATVGSDIGDYRAWLERHGIQLDAFKMLSDVLTAQAFVTTDLDDNQITAFYGGAMLRAEEASLAGLKNIALGIVSPNGTRAMLNAADYFRKHNIPFIADPGQSIPALNADELIDMIHGAEVLIANDYEWEMIQKKLKVNLDTILDHVEHLIVTYGAQGSKLWSRKKEVVDIPACEARAIVDPTGCGDAYRAGVLWGLKQPWTIEKAAQVGSWLAAQAIAYAGTQNHTVDRLELQKFIESL